MKTIDAIIEVIEQSEIENLFRQILPAINPLIIDENYSLVIDGDKFLNFWIIQEKGLLVKDFSLTSRLSDEEILITGYFGINHAKNSMIKFGSLIDELIAAINTNSSLYEELKRIISIERSMTSKTFGNILCHCCEISVKVLRIERK